jgi:predicted aconitase with swiveling domain
VNDKRTLLASGLSGEHCGGMFVHDKRLYQLKGVRASTSGTHVRLDVQRAGRPATLFLDPTEQIVIEP